MLPLRGPTSGGRVGRWREELRRGLRRTPHVTLAVSLLVLVTVNAWWLREQSGAVDAGRLPFAAALPRLPQAGSTTTSWPVARPSSTTATTAVRVDAAVAPVHAPAAAVPVLVVGPGPGEQPAPAAKSAPAGVPVSLRIDHLDVEADVLEVGVAPDGSLDVPDLVSDVGWFSDGVRPGEPGSAVLVGHVDAASQGPGAFFLLRDAEVGGRVSVLDDHGTRLEFEIVARREYRKSELPVDSLFGRGGPAVLTLITCGGDFDPQTRSYDSNIVVHAVPVNEPAG